MSISVLSFIVDDTGMVLVAPLRRTLPNPDALVTISKGKQTVKLIEQNPPVTGGSDRIKKKKWGMTPRRRRAVQL